MHEIYDPLVVHGLIIDGYIRPGVHKLAYSYIYLDDKEGLVLYMEVAETYWHVLWNHL